MMFLQCADPGDENNSERDDLCSRCGSYLPLDPIYGKVRYSCGDCHGGEDIDYFPVTLSELSERAWDQKHGRSWR